jgi:hypothetical protein
MGHLLAFTAICALFLVSVRGLKPVPFVGLTMVLTFFCVATILLGHLRRLMKVSTAK